MPSIRSLLILLPLIYVAAIADAAVGPRLAIADVSPDAFVLVALLWLSARPESHGYLAAGLIGLASDLCAPGRPGVGMACFLFVGYAACHLLDRISPRQPLARIAVVSSLAIVLLVALGLCRWAVGETALPLSDVARSSAAAGAYTAVLFAVLLAAFQCAPRLEARAKRC